MKRILFATLLLLSLTACTAQSETESDTAVSQPNTSVQNSGARATPTNASAGEVAAESSPTDTPQPVVEPTDEPETAVVDTPTSEPEPAAEILDPMSELTIDAEDGTPIATTLYLPEGEGPHPGVILLHMLGGRRQDWEVEEIPNLLTEAGYVVLAVDMRGHGQTPGNRDWALVEQDLITVWEEFVALAQVDREKTAVMGGSIGSNMALITGDNIPEIQTTILLSPGLDYFGVTTDDRIVSYGDRPILIVASEEDTTAAESSVVLADLAATGELLMFNGVGHGTRMLNQPNLQLAIVDWLDTNLK